jgi:hypothetical protein
MRTGGALLLGLGAVALASCGGKVVGGATSSTPFDPGVPTYEFMPGADWACSGDEYVYVENSEGPGCAGFRDINDGRSYALCDGNAYSVCSCVMPPGWHGDPLSATGHALDASSPGDAGDAPACSFEAGEEALKSCPACADGGVVYTYCIGTHSTCACTHPTPNDATDGKE